MTAAKSHDRLPGFVQDLLAARPKAGGGVHPWLFKVARQLHAHLPAGDIVKLLENRVADCGRHVPRTEIVDAVQSSLRCAWQPSSAVSRRSTCWQASVRSNRVCAAGGSLHGTFRRGFTRLR